MGEYKIVVALDYADYSRANTPPFVTVKNLIIMAQTHYPELLAYLVVVDAPFLLRSLWKLIRPFVDPDTREKVKFVNGETQKIQVLGPLIKDDQAMPFMLPNGKMTSSVDVHHFLNEVP